MCSADMAVTAGGLMAFEALSVGVPLCALSLDRFQRVTVQALCRAGACVNLGSARSITPANTSVLLRRTLEDRELRARLSSCGRRIVDGRGAERVAQLISGAIPPRIPGGPE
jgi:spore coat polysaccharide biosynthesis predicted glycosyltransferase SpsG